MSDTLTRSCRLATFCWSHSSPVWGVYHGGVAGMGPPCWVTVWQMTSSGNKKMGRAGMDHTLSVTHTLMGEDISPFTKAELLEPNHLKGRSDNCISTWVQGRTNDDTRMPWFREWSIVGARTLAGCIFIFFLSLIIIKPIHRPKNAEVPTGRHLGLIHIHQLSPGHLPLRPELVPHLWVH